MFMITKKLLNLLEKNKNDSTALQGLLSGITNDPEKEQLGNSESLYPSIEKFGTKLNFIHGSDWHFPLLPKTKNKNEKRDDIIAAFTEISETIINAGGIVNGIISSGDYLNAVEIKNFISQEKTEDKENKIDEKVRYIELWQEKLSYASQMLEAVSNNVGIDYRHNVLAIPGNHDVILAKNELPNDKPFKDAFSRFVNNLDNELYFAKHDFYSSAIPTCTMYRTPSGIVAFIGFTSTGLDALNKMGCGFIGQKQTGYACDFIKFLKTTPAFSDTPIVVIGVLHHHLANIVDDRHKPGDSAAQMSVVHDASDNTIFDTRDFLETMSENGMKFFIHGHQHTLLSYDLSYVPLSEKKKSDPENKDVAFNAISCCALPSTTKDDGIYHFAILTVDFEQGRIFYKPVEYNHDDEYVKQAHDDDPGRSFPIHSISEVPCDERRLYRNMCNWLSLSDAGKSCDEFPLLLNKEKIADFKKKFDETWHKKHVVSVCLAHSTKDKNLTETDYFHAESRSLGNFTSFYDLYAIPRQNPRDVSKYDLLMNYHVGIETPIMARWRTFLLPSTKVASIAAFVQILRWNIQRILYFEDKIEKRGSLEDLVKKLRGAERNCGIYSTITPNTLATQKFCKMSPTTGHPEILYYNLVQLPRFIMPEKGDITPQDNAVINIRTVVLEALEKIPTLDDFKKFWKRQSDEWRGLAWIPMDTLLSNHEINDPEKDPLALFPERNADVLGFLEESIRAGDKGTSWRFKKNISVIKPEFDENSKAHRTFTKRSRDELFERIHDVQLRGKICWNDDDERRLYSRERAHVALVKFSIAQLTGKLSSVKPQVIDSQGEEFPKAQGLYPAQNYVSEFGLDRVRRLADDALSWKEKIDIFTLGETSEDEGFYCVSENRKPVFDVLPPVIEYSTEASLGDIWLICDGMHRVYSAIEKAKKTKNSKDPDTIALTAIAVWPKNSTSWRHAPYYAYPTTWESVRETPNKPPAMYAKFHRVENKDFCDTMKKKYKVKAELLRDAKNFYRKFERKDSPGKPFLIGTQGGE